jgi:hypothetical protein
MKDIFLWMALAIVVYVVMALGSGADGHEAVVIDVANGNGVLAQICTSYAKEKYPNDPEAAKVEAQECYDWAAREMHPKEYTHEHS